MGMDLLKSSLLPESGQTVIILQVHPRVQRLHGPVEAVEPSKAVYEVSVESWINEVRGELAHAGYVIGPGSPVADNLLVVAEDGEVSPEVGAELRTGLDPSDMAA